MTNAATQPTGGSSIMLGVEAWVLRRGQSERVRGEASPRCHCEERGGGRA